MRPAYTYIVRMTVPTLRLRTINNLLTIVVALLAVYIIVTPFLPQFGWWLKHDTPVKTVVHTVNVAPIAKGAQQPTISGDVLVIPRIDMQETIRGGDMRSLRYGVWHVPHTSTPDKGGNTVLVGHRYTYTNPQGVFYFLNKIQIGDPITVYWQGNMYAYTVTNIEVVPSTAVEIENNTAAPMLTLYTCTPLWNPVDRLVVQASLTGKPS